MICIFVGLINICVQLNFRLSAAGAVGASGAEAHAMIPVYAPLFDFRAVSDVPEAFGETAAGSRVERASAELKHHV